jgi:hypothetical protein
MSAPLKYPVTAFCIEKKLHDSVICIRALCSVVSARFSSDKPDIPSDIVELSSGSQVPFGDKASIFPAAKLYRNKTLLIGTILDK